MTHEERQNRRALKQLAAQVSGGSRNTADATSVAQGSTGKAMLGIGLILLTCLAWLTYSRWLQPARAAEENPVAVRLVDSSNAAGAVSETSDSALPFHRAAAGASKSSQTNSATPGTKIDAKTPDEGLEKKMAPVEDFARRGDPKAVPAVLDALRDDDWRVRSRAMDAAVNAYVSIPESALIDHVQSDPSPEVRFLALAGIAARIDPEVPLVPAIDRETARSLSQLALSDANEHVRWQAQQILDSLNASHAPPAEDQAQGAAL